MRVWPKLASGTMVTDNLCPPESPLLGHPARTCIPLLERRDELKLTSLHRVMATFPFGEDFWGEKEFGKILRRARRKPPKLYNVEDVVAEEKRRGETWVKVKWAGSWPGQQHSWVPLQENPELEAYLHHYREATALGRGGTQEDSSTIQYLKTAILTALGEGSHKAGQYNTKASLTIPFPRTEFDKHFRSLNIIGWVAGPSGQPETFSCHPTELIAVLGRGWHRKPLKSSSLILVTEVRVTWGYRPVVRYDHSECPRCTHKRAERLRPSQCCPKV
ncbi:PREDICTED: uncharacterized protein LOC109463812 [Branchiostoma belcheri]|uniref:Uncharacterized protein LOC109463812 n=1 Tax=Branchiostoma belcheri TaxID=7741 RepID=A0A6P4Y0V5_BRABE|nr:PREDICTED: uncharacterized protein LOC109463812 [Branchiostoma belcheri]